jgi:hypothetical protein
LFPKCFAKIAVITPRHHIDKVPCGGSAPAKTKHIELDLMDALDGGQYPFKLFFYLCHDLGAARLFNPRGAGGLALVGPRPSLGVILPFGCADTFNINLDKERALTWWKIEGISPLCQKIRTIEFTLKISSKSKITRLHADLNPLSKTQKNLSFGENWERFYALWRERAREIPGARIHPYNMLLLTLTKSKQQRMDEHENSVRVL